MKIKIILPLLIVAIGQGVFGQSKIKTDSNPCPKCEIATWNNNTVRLSETYISHDNVAIGSPLEFSTYSQPQAVWIYSGTALMTRIEPKPNITKIDSLIIYVRKSQLRWINDSTAVIHKSN